ncbi:MAG TPA: alpha/beta hydrolase [Rhizomicrobium sp.]|jgi:3-oxoadipate enol-lactonase|nr:alpha/beta hydrolase [Rhizomicrobium sp.]
MSLRALGLAVFLAAFATVPASSQSDDGAFVTVEGGRVWYQTCGTGPRSMALIHDGTLHSATWDDVWPIFCKDFHVVRYDRRGYGRSPAATEPYARTDDVLAVMRAAGMAHAVVVGASAGGGIAVDFTLAHPDAVDRLVLVGPSISGLRYSQYFNRRVMENVRQFQQGDLEGAMRSGWAFAPGHEAAVVRAAALVKANPQNLMHGDMARLAPTAKPLLSKIQAQTLVLVGDHDVADNEGEAATAEALIPRAYRIVVPDTSHLMYMEHPDVFAQLVEQFVDAKPHPDREASVRRYVESLEKGAPNYGEMVEAEAADVRQELPQLLQLVRAMGALKSVTYEHGTDDGADVYLVSFEHGQAEWTIGPLTADGKVQTRRVSLL